MPIQMFQIFLDKQAEPYQSGEQITGKFVIVVTDGYNHNGIYLKFEGHAIIKWTEDSSCFEHTVAKQHRARKQFFETMFKYASEEFLPEGTHIFPFEYTLPENLPSSLSTPTTTIWYKMEALLNKDPKPRREVLVFPLSGTLDLNNFSEELAKSVSEVKSKSLFGFVPPCLCNLHYVSIGMKLKKTGFLPGEKLPIVLAVLTDSMSLTFVTLSLVQEITVITKEKTMIERRTVVKLMLPDLHPQKTEDDYRRWEQVITVPRDTVVTSDTDLYEDCKIKYFLKFSAEASKFPYKVLKIVVPITIGSVALSPASLNAKKGQEDQDSNESDDDINGDGNNPAKLDDPKTIKTGTFSNGLELNEKDAVEVDNPIPACEDNSEDAPGKFYDMEVPKIDEDDKTKSEDLDDSTCFPQSESTHTIRAIIEIEPDFAQEDPIPEEVLGAEASFETVELTELEENSTTLESFSDTAVLPIFTMTEIPPPPAPEIESLVDHNVTDSCDHPSLISMTASELEFEDKSPPEPIASSSHQAIEMQSKSPLLTTPSKPNRTGRNNKVGSVAGDGHSPTVKRAFCDEENVQKLGTSSKDGLGKCQGKISPIPEIQSDEEISFSTTV